MIRKVKFITIPVRDQDRAMTFTSIFSALPADRSADGTGQRGSSCVRPKAMRASLFTPPGHEDRIGTFTGISLECDDVQKTYDELAPKVPSSPSPRRPNHGA